MNRFIKSVGFAINGLRVAWREQPNFKIHLLAMVLVNLAAWLVKLNVTEWAVVIICVGVVLAAELFNSAIEKIVDWVNPQWSKQAGKIKDIAAAAVLVVAISSVCVAILIFTGKFM
ncbi:MAG: diacylglycerol kinase family protein [Flammeovirgaceae bacterium]